jgi:hypothetical protein
MTETTHGRRALAMQHRRWWHKAKRIGDKIRPRIYGGAETAFCAVCGQQQRYHAPSGHGHNWTDPLIGLAAHYRNLVP